METSSPLKSYGTMDEFVALTSNDVHLVKASLYLSLEGWTAFAESEKASGSPRHVSEAHPSEQNSRSVVS